MMPEQRRVQAASTVVLPCYAHPSVKADDATTNYFPLRRRRAARGSRVGDVTRRKLRHGRRAGRQPAAGETVGPGRWRYEWRRDDDPIDAESGSGRFSVDARDHSLTIRDVSSATDTAMYSCRRRRRSHGNAANSSASDDVITSRQIQLVVQGSRSALH